MPNNDSSILVDGSLDFSGGVDSIKPTTIASQANPGGLPRNCLAWLINGTVRDGGISPRAGWQPNVQVLTTAVLANILAGTSGYQGGFLYEPQGANPYLIISFAGDIYKVDPNTKTVVNLSQQFNLHNPPNVDHAYFCQGEQFLVIQAGDGKTLPLFWDGATLRRSNGLQPSTAANTVISTDTQTFTVPTEGNDVTLTWSSTTGVNQGDTVILYLKGTSTSFGTYTIKTKAGLTLTLTKVDFNAAPFRVGPTQFDLTLAKSAGIIKASELPAGYAMVYYMQRIWYVYLDQRTYTAGDIVGDASSGTQQYNFTDSILKVTENPLAIGGDGFHLPSNSGTIRALVAPATIDASLGQGRLYIFTRKQVYALSVPVSRADWISANNTNAPLQVVVQITNGSTGDRCIVGVNGDLYYQTLQPAIASLIAAVRYFDQPGNTPISSPENRIIQFNNRELLSFASGIEFDNRLLQTALPRRLPQGTVHDAILPLDFTPVSEPNSRESAVWEGHYEGLPILQMFTGDYGGLQRSFAIIVSKADGSVWLWEMTQGDLRENGDNRIPMVAEFPAFTWEREFDLKRLVGGELWVDRVSGTVDFTLEYRQDGSACYIPWHKWKICSARDCNENIPPNCPPPPPYPTTPTPFGLGYRQTIGFPKPPNNCDQQMGRPSDIAHQFQPRLTVHGSCRIRGILLYATYVQKATYMALPC